MAHNGVDAADVDGGADAAAMAQDGVDGGADAAATAHDVDDVDADAGEREMAPPYPLHDHPPVKWSRRTVAKYHLFSAARRGCHQCVAHWTTWSAAAASWTSDTNNWQALDWAVQGLADGYGDPDALRGVIAYLQALPR